MHTIWDYSVCWKHLTEKEKQDVLDRVKQHARERKEFVGIALSGAELMDIDFSRVDFKGAFLEGCNFENSRFTDASFEDCFLAGANLNNSALERTNLSGAVFTGASLWNSKIFAYSIKDNPINLYEESFRNLKNTDPKIYESEPRLAAHTYRELKRYFSEHCDYDSASWAAFKERTMQKKHMFKEKNYASWLSFLFWGFSCGYGEKPQRVVVFCVSIVVAFALLFQANQLLVYNINIEAVSFADSLLVSFATFSTYNFSDIAFKSCFLARFLVSLEAFVGIFSAGLFVFTLTKKYVAR
jgi:uncharacterized protein YjbI with pentapeptide repeats